MQCWTHCWKISTGCSGQSAIHWSREPPGQSWLGVVLAGVGGVAALLPGLLRLVIASLLLLLLLLLGITTTTGQQLQVLPAVPRVRAEKPGINIRAREAAHFSAVDLTQTL